MSQRELGAILAELQTHGASYRDPRLIVGTETGDDAGVFRLNDAQAIVCTADFVPPVADDPWLFGRIAAANALSDVYAMGGQALTALALCLFPKELSEEAARAIVAGGQSAVADAGAVIIGGHTVRAVELFYGLAVTGVVHPARVTRNVGARAGDALILTKPLGAGLVVNGLRKGVLTLDEARPTLEAMGALNRAASEVAVESGAVHAMTDVTGFALTGHALGMARGSGVRLHVSLGALPLYAPARAMADAGVTTAATKTNREYAANMIAHDDAWSPFWDQLVHDPQTSGGLLLAVDGDRADALVTALHARGVSAARVVGSVGAGEPGIAFAA